MFIIIIILNIRHFSLFLFVCKKNNSSGSAHPLSLLLNWLQLQNSSRRWCVFRNRSCFSTRTDCLKLSIVLQSTVTQGLSRAALKHILRSASYLYFEEWTFLIFLPFSLYPHIPMQREACHRQEGRAFWTRIFYNVTNLSAQTVQKK